MIHNGHVTIRLIDTRILLCGHCSLHACPLMTGDTAALRVINNGLQAAVSAMEWRAIQDVADGYSEDDRVLCLLLPGPPVRRLVCRWLHDTIRDSDYPYRVIRSHQGYRTYYKCSGLGCANDVFTVLARDPRHAKPFGVSLISDADMPGGLLRSVMIE